jgi:hypothetical protein
MREKQKPVNLRTVAERVGLAACSVSAILNNTPAAQAIPQSTRERVFRAAAELNYRPNLWARSLRTRRTRMVAVVASDFGHQDVARVIAGLQSRLHRKDYLLALATPEFGEPHHVSAFQQRGIEGIIAINTLVPEQVDLPVASVEVGDLIELESSMELTSHWLARLGESAAETIIQQIEQESSARRTYVEAKLPRAYFDLPAAVLEANVTARESA